MPYEVLEKKIKTIPAQYVAEVADFIDYICFKHKDEIGGDTKDIDFSFVDNIFGKLSHEEAEELRASCHLHFKEI